ncbi:MAG: LysM domain-containing protein [Kiritimatiellae bacterium]|jgi:LysM repeat protein|nr:LysM domain-containing protein [Kiritimatiellia bacterium]
MLYRISSILFFCLLGTTGCLQTRETALDRAAQQRALEQRQQQQLLSEHRQRIQLQFEDSEAQLLNTREELRQVKGELAAHPSRDDLNRLDNRISALEQMIQRMEAQRTRDREELLEILSQRIATVLSQQQARQAASSGRTHEVAQGETLSAIAAAYRVSSQAIIQVNNLQNPNALRIGQKLTIPGN